MAKRHIVVIGGGAAGTAAARKLLQADCGVTIVEQNDRLGGRIYSPGVGGHHIEVGGGFITRAYRHTHQFLREAGLASQLRRGRGSSAILRAGNWYHLTPAALVFGRLVSTRAKLRLLRAGFEVLTALPKLDVRQWQSAGSGGPTIRQAYSDPAGRELTDYLFDCLLNGYLYWSPDDISNAALPLLAKILAAGPATTLQGGMQQVPQALAAGCDIKLSTTVQKVEKTKSGFTVHTKGAGGTTRLPADGVICATTATAAAKIMPLTPKQARFFTAVKYSATAVAVRHYEQPVTLPAGAMGFPRAESLPAAAITRAAEAHSGSSPTHTRYIKCYASGDAGAGLCRASDQEILDRLSPTRLLRDPALQRPSETLVQRWPQALPIFSPGHFQRLAEFAQGHIENPATAVAFAGDYLGGPFIEGAVTSGQEAAGRLLQRLSVTR